MDVVIDSRTVETLFPITGAVENIKVAGRTIAELIRERFAPFPGDGRRIRVRGDFLPSPTLAELARNTPRPLIVRGEMDGAELLVTDFSGGEAVVLEPDAGSLRIRYPWDLLTLNEQLVGGLETDEIFGIVRDGVTIDGHIRLGRGSVILPGVYIEGNAVFGEDCKIGPNCYIRGNTATGDRCHIGQAVEVKNSLLFDRVSIGHLSYVGDSVICARVNFGAGTIVSNLRHDGRNHRWKYREEWIDTGRRKFGAVVGEGVHTGIHTAIYPGRMLPPGAETRPGDVVER